MKSEVLTGTRVSRTLHCLLVFACPGLLAAQEDVRFTSLSAEKGLPSSVNVMVALSPTASGRTCGRTVSNRLLCWGDVGFDNGNVQPIVSPLPFTRAGRAFVAVEKWCGLTAQGKLYCWGLTGGILQLVAANAGVPARDDGLVELAPNMSFDTSPGAWAGTCGIAGAGELHCGLPAGSRQLAPGTRFRQVAQGGEHHCALSDENRAYCWGGNSLGQLGRGGIAVRELNEQQEMEQAEARPVSEDLAFASMSAGAAHTCGLSVAGKVWCWGNDTEGQLGQGKVSQQCSRNKEAMRRPCSTRPLQVAGLPLMATVSAGGFHTCALSADRAVWCWGSNQYGQLGRTVKGRCNLQPLAQQQAQNVQNAGDALGEAMKTMNAAFAESMAEAERVAKESGMKVDLSREKAGPPVRGGLEKSVSDMGETGKRMTESAQTQTTECSPAPIRVAGVPEFVSLEGGDGYHCGLTADGVAWCWGRNDLGQLGDGTRRSTRMPVRVGAPTGAGK